MRVIHEKPTEGEELLYQSGQTRVTRRRPAKNLPSLIYKEAIGPNGSTRVRHENQILARLNDIHGVPKVALVSGPDNILVLQDSNARPLTQIARAENWDLASILRTCLQLARVLGEIHRRSVIHTDINPSNILLMLASCEPLLIDFDTASTCIEHAPILRHREMTVALAYLAPEQTGSTGRVVDHRADLYSLGATFYELTTRRKPFEQDDPLLLMRDHLTRAPTPPATIDPRLPPSLSEIILRLLEKEPDRRYQSADGLAYDLARVQSGFLSGVEPHFPLGERDFPPRLTPPSRLIGREVEINILQTALANTSNGAARCVLVSGAPGAGKTTLISELKPAIAAQNGWFLSGKFDQFRQDSGSDAVWQAFGSLSRLLLSEPDDLLETLRSQIQRNLGSSAALLSALMPELESILGGHATSVGDDPRTLQARMVRAWLDLVRTVASRERPIVMVLDDLQWSGTAALQFIDAVLTADRLDGFLLIGAFREGEVTEFHPLSMMLSHWKSLGCAPELLPLRSLPPGDLATLLEEMLRLPRERAATLADVIGERTGGNPYDAVELVNALKSEGLLRLTDEGWRWDEEPIRQYRGGEIVDLIKARIDSLPIATRQLLDQMACLSNRLELELLQAASGESGASLETLLTPAIENQLIVRRQDVSSTVEFQHDRVQQAAYARLNESQRHAIHLILARQLIRHPEHTTVAARQFQSVLADVVDADEQRRVIAAFRLAAAHAARTADHAMVEQYLSAATQLLDALGAGPSDTLRMEIQIERHAACYSLGRLEDADRIYSDIARHCLDTLQCAQSVCIQVQGLTHRMQDGLSLGRSMLAELGFPVSQQDITESGRRIDDLERWVTDSLESDDLQRPEITDPRLLAAASLINAMAPAAFFSDRMMLTYLVCEAQRLWEEHGPSILLVSPLCHASPVTIANRQDYRTGYRVTRRALAFSEARNFELISAHARFLFTIGCHFWFEPLEDTYLHAQRAREGLVRSGDPQTACYAYLASFLALLEWAPTLEPVERELQAAMAFATRSRHQIALSALMLHRALLDVLQSDFIPLTPDVEQARDQAVLLKLGGHVAATLVFHTDRAIANLVLANMERLTHHALALVPCLEHCPGLYQTALGRILQAFALIQRLRSASAPDRDGLQQEIEPLIDWIARRAADAPNNFLSLSSLINAEHAWARSDFELAAHTYDKAIQESTSLKRPWHRALITERAALFHLENGLRHTGQTLLAEARHLYADWGARAKVQQLERQYDFLRTSETSRGEKHSETIDFLAILRTSQALSSETHLGSLKAKVTELLGAMTGATLVHLVLHDDANGWHVSAESDTSTTRVPVAEAGARGMLPHSAFRYVERTRQPLVVENAARDDRFARDPYFAGLSRCSLLCVPISVHGALLGVLMLENRLSHSAFAADRLDTLLLITGQLAVSLQNARIYAALEQKVAERTVELEKTHRRLLEMSRQAGMTEVASNVLHNVGNVLNSANVSVTLIAESITRSKLPGLGRLVSLMNEHEQHLPTFFGSDPRGKHVPAYLRELLDTLQNERTETLREIESLNRHIGHIKEIVASQQTLAKRVAVRTAVDVNELIEEALRMTLGVQNQSPVSVIRRFGAMPPVILEQHKVLQILINLISNASHACEESGRLDAQLIVQSSHDGATLKIIITDNGMGISPENLTRIFAHGFTTRRGGHGFGLHSCALAAKEMGGSLSAHSAGLAQGATFTLELPMEQPP